MIKYILLLSILVTSSAQLDSRTPQRIRSDNAIVQVQKENSFGRTTKLLRRNNMEVDGVEKDYDLSMPLEVAQFSMSMSIKSDTEGADIDASPVGCMVDSDCSGGQLCDCWADCRFCFQAWAPCGTCV